MRLKGFLALLLLLCVCLLSVGCGRGIKRGDAKETAEAFLAAVEKGDLESARSYLHPQSPLDVEEYLDGIEARRGIDFQKEIEIRRYTEYSSELYDSDVDGSEYELEMQITVDGVPLRFGIEIVKNGFGYGIYEIDLE